MARKTTTTKVLEDTMLSNVRGWHQLGQKSKEAITNTGLHQAADLMHASRARLLEEPHMGPFSVKKIFTFFEQVKSYQAATASGATVDVASAPTEDLSGPEPRPQATVTNDEYKKLAVDAAKVGQALFLEVIEEKTGSPDELGVVSIDPGLLSHVEQGRHGIHPMIHWDTVGGPLSARVRHSMKDVYAILAKAKA